jgi:hypothetical protein
MQEYGLDTLKFIIFKFQNKGRRLFGVGFVLWFLLLFLKKQGTGYESLFIFGHVTINCHVKDGFIIIIIIIIMDIRVRVNLHTLQLIIQALKLIIL